MNEEEIIKYIKDEIEVDKDTISWFEDKKNPTRKQIEECVNAHQGILDLYNKEKEKNKELEEERDILREQLNSVFDRGFIHKDKIKEVLEKYRKTSIEDGYRIIQFYKELEKTLSCREKK